MSFPSQFKSSKSRYAYSALNDGEEEDESREPMMNTEMGSFRLIILLRLFHSIIDVLIILFFWSYLSSLFRLTFSLHWITCSWAPNCSIIILLMSLCHLYIQIGIIWKWNLQICILCKDGIKLRNRPEPEESNHQDQVLIIQFTCMPLSLYLRILQYNFIPCIVF